jgi:FtsP/CotA-like multicopper oxidase with cupredoxin domain
MMKRAMVWRLAVLALTLLWGVDSAFAQGLDNGPPRKKTKITHADRAAAAARAKAGGFVSAAEAAAAGVVAPMAAMPGDPPQYFSHPNYANSPILRKFVDPLPNIPLATPDRTTYPGSDYYEIALVQYRQRMHGDLPAVGTLLRGYVQLATATIAGTQELSTANLDGTSTPIPGYLGVTAPQYLGPAIVAAKDRPVRILFRNLLPTGVGGDLFLPVDTTVMGSGMGPAMGGMDEMDPQNPMCGMSPKPYGCYSDNRATLHLHGGISPWISDGTPHQWITPTNETAAYEKGVSVASVPDMWFDQSGNTISSCAGQITCAVAGAKNDPGAGAMTFYYTNQQSARLMFYHDHAWGITRLNVYAGEAAAYIITDDMEQALVGANLVPAVQIPLVIQDKTFVDADRIPIQDNTWDPARWGGTGNLWVPHVYSPAQNPGDASGVNQFGRWAYGPWFWPPTSFVDHGPIPNPYYCGPDGMDAQDPPQACSTPCDPDLLDPTTGAPTWCEPPLMPGVPYSSMGMESFNDTPVVNGVAYPYLEVQPTAYRFRILNAANDRFFNLSLYEALAAADPADPGHLKEVELNAAEVAAALGDPAGVFPTPVAPPGPSWIQIGTEGGFLPTPVVIPPQPTTWVTDPTVFNAGNVDKHSLLLGPAERADVIVDFAQYAGKTLILYNDAPAAFPARDPRYDYYTGNPDLTDTGGAPPTMAGYGPNTRTVMQIKVAPAPEGTQPAAFALASLQTAFKAESLGGMGVFANSQHPVIVGQGEYNPAYGTSFRTTGPTNGTVQIYQTSFTFDALSGVTLQNFPLQPKMIQDEQGEAFEKEYGRMSGFLGVETPNPQAGQQNMILYPFTAPPTEIIDTRSLPRSGLVDAQGIPVAVTPIARLDDGTQIWKVTHNGVDTHPIHFHLYDVQLLNRVGWDGIIRKPDANELGWKDTVRVSPLEDTIVALRPVIPTVPFDLPNSIRLIDPSMPEGAYLANTTLAEQMGGPILAFDPNGEPIDIINHYVNYGWEYVWHCHILSHEEMDMMRAVAVAIAPKTPSGLVATRVGSGGSRRVNLSWTDNSLNETAFVIERATSLAGPYGSLAGIPSGASGPATGARTYTDAIGNTNQAFYYRVRATNVVGDTWDYTDPALNEGAAFPTKTLDSGYSNVASWVATTPPAAPSNVSATAALQGGNARITLTWTDNANNESGFTIQRATSAAFTTGLVTATVGANVQTFQTGNLPRNTSFYFRIWATNAVGASNVVIATPFPVLTP